MSGILAFFHCGTNAGFAIERLERVFLDAMRATVPVGGNVVFGYPDLVRGYPQALLDSGVEVVQLDPSARIDKTLDEVAELVRTRGIQVALGFDQQPQKPIYRALRHGGVSRIVSYWGAPMSDVNHGLKLALKRAQVAFDWNGPDHYVFESEAMLKTGTNGRGISPRRASVVRLGVDTGVFSPPAAQSFYAHDAFGVPRNRRVVYYSGHMEPRKGVGVIMKAAIHLVDVLGIADVQFLLCGNRDGEELVYTRALEGTLAAQHVTFGGYRSDVARLMQSAAVGTIASTGWDSFTMSAVELMASGVPLVVSRLQGLAETVVEGETGFTFSPGAHEELAVRLAELLRDEPRRSALGAAARARAVREFSVQQQVAALAQLLRP